MTYEDLADVLAQVEGISGAELVDVRFAELTTLHLGGAPLAAVRVHEGEALAGVLRLLDAAKAEVLIVGGGSNLVIADGQVPVVAVLLAFDGVEANPATGVLVAEAGAVWDEVVELSVELGLGGIECLSGIPGSVGATPVQNVGAYGVEIADVLTRVKLYDRRTGDVGWHPASSLDLSYRHSNLKFTNRAVVLAVELQLRTDGLSAPLRYGELPDERRPVAEVRESVLALRRGKGMVYDPEDHDTWSAGSFFTNPILPHGQVHEGGPEFPADEGMVKLSAAWLIEHSGFPKGYPGEGAPARLSTKHTLALTNRGAATTADLVALAAEVRDGVYRAYGVELVPEPVWVGVELPPISTRD
ncbi:UDP-N-acetylmuramate dehydrogenase [Corynebacterium kozikiae]|uniref:UDP-N-acetylmuramate dehydrogenase n=1 Tax=Corynebacterium kozikiae TaxID=2968469 RepID=UPI00359C61E4